MQIGPNTLLSFLPGSTQASAAQAGDRDARASQGAASAEALRQPPAAQEDAAGVILSIQSELPAAANAAVPGDLVYSNVRKNTVRTDQGSDTERMALQHQQALERTAGNSSSLSVDKDGVLVAEPASPAEIRAQQFVHYAVGAMRQYADEQDRLKMAAARQDDSAAAASLIPRSLAEVQKLAARFKLFV